MATFTRVSAGEVQALLNDKYGFSRLASLEQVPQGSVNSNYRVGLEDGTRLFFRLYEEQDVTGARREAALLLHLAEHGVQTPPPLSTRDGEPIVLLRNKPTAIFPWREGRMRCQASVTAHDTRQVGAALAKVHVTGVSKEAFLGAGRFNAAQLHDRIDARIATSDDPLSSEADGLHEALEACEKARATDLPQGLIHGDLFRDNVLWNERAVSALLDFESASRGPWVFDLAVAMLAWCVGDGLDLGLARSMVEGYESVRSLSQAERRGFYQEAIFATLRFTITRITDYALRPSGGGNETRQTKDWRRFAMRREALELLGPAGTQAGLGLTRAR